MKHVMHSRIVQVALLALVMLACAIFIHPYAALAPLVPVVFGMAAPEATNSDVIRQLAAWRVLCPMGGPILQIKIKTADYTIVDPFTAGGGDASGTIFSNRGAAGTVNFTLPAPAPRLAGVVYDFIAVVAAQIVLVKTATPDTLIAFNDLTADSLSIATAGEIIGSSIRCICDGTSWIAFGTAKAATYTVAT